MSPAARAGGDSGAPDTPALRAVRALGVAHQVHVVEPPRSVDEAAERYGIPVERLLKTLVVRRAEDDHLLVLVPGPRQLDWPKLRAHLGVTRLSLADAAAARAVTGYAPGTITPFGTPTPLPVIADASIPADGAVTVGGGRPGVSIRIDAGELLRVLGAEVADVTR